LRKIVIDLDKILSTKLWLFDAFCFQLLRKSQFI
jgi:hypothetical protein